MKVTKYEKEIAKLEADAVMEFGKRIKAFCDKYNMKFVAGNGMWYLDEVNPPEDYYHEIGETEFSRSGGTSVFEDFQERVDFIVEKFNKIYEDGYIVGSAFRLDGNFLIMCDDYTPKPRSKK